MSRGLPWLPLLFLITWLAWAGWNEFQKVQAYSQWAEAFDKSKYDLYAVLGLKGQEITWGKPTRKAPVNLQTFSLQQVTAIALTLDSAAIAREQLETSDRPPKGKVALQFQLSDASQISIPFTDVALAAQWSEYLRSRI